MKKPTPLDYKSLRQTLSPSRLLFNSSNKLKPIIEFVGQDRALEALQFGIGIKRQGYNLYAMGPSGIGKLSLVQAVLNKQASKSSVPSDWCYVHNFTVPENPVALEFPAGQGLVFQQDMKKFIEEVGNAILSTESDEYRIAMQTQPRIQHQVNKRKEKTNTQKCKSFGSLSEKHEQEKYCKQKLVTDVITPIVNKLNKKYAKYPNVSSISGCR